MSFASQLSEAVDRGEPLEEGKVDYRALSKIQELTTEIDEAIHDTMRKIMRLDGPARKATAETYHDMLKLIRDEADKAMRNAKKL